MSYQRGAAIMESRYGKVVLVTGASSGIGKAIAERLANEGFRVYGTSRKAEGEEVIIEETASGGFFKLINLDVRSNESAQKAAAYVTEKEGSIDILINNAGFGISGPIEETTPEEAISQFDTNFFGMHRMVRSVLPGMRERGKGLIINISSVAGLFALPYQAFYCASKYAVEAFSEALRMEVKDFGIKVSLIEPGDTKTGFTQNRYFCEGSKHSAYKRSQMSVEKMMRDEQNGPGPEIIANIVVRILKRKNPPVRVIAGFSYKLLVFLKRLLPSRLVVFLVSKIY